MRSYLESTEEKMKEFYNTLNEKDRRRYAAIEALKLGHGGITYISGVLGCDRKTVAKGVKELEELTSANHTNQQNELENETPLDETQPQINGDGSQVNLSSDSKVNHDMPHLEMGGDNQNRAAPESQENKSQEDQVQDQSSLKAAQQLKNKEESKKQKDSKVNQKCSQNKRRVRKSGAGRKTKSVEIPSLHQKILDILAHHTAGDPMREGLIWTNLRAGQISELLKKKHKISVSLKVIRKILKKLGYSCRKAKKSETMKQCENRNEQFENIARLKEQYQNSNNPIISMDTKKKDCASRPLGGKFR